MADIQAPSPSPGVGARRKGPKSLPRLPLSAFNPPNSGSSEVFSLPPTPSTTHPTNVIDGYLSIKDVHSSWKAEAGRVSSRKISSVVLALPLDSQPAAIDQIVQDHPSLKILSVTIPINLDQGPPAEIPSFGPNVTVSLSVSFVQNSPKLVEGLKWALGKGYIVDIDVQAAVKDNGQGWGSLEELLSEVLGSGENGTKPALGGAVILSNILPPTHDLGISIVKLLNHPTYRAYQADTASLSLFPSLYIKFLPPRWNATTPATLGPSSNESASAEDNKEKKEWKRRVKMYLGPAVEAFGYQRIIYGSWASTTGSDSNDWYEIARESLVELGIEQDGLDAVFATNASAVYGGA